MAWKKAPPELIELLEEILPKDPRAERRKMFGYPCSFVNGNLCKKPSKTARAKS